MKIGLTQQILRLWIIRYLKITLVTTKMLALDLPSKYNSVRLTPIREYDWGKECFLHDPSGILWHIGEFFN